MRLFMGLLLLFILLSQELPAADPVIKIPHTVPSDDAVRTVGDLVVVSLLPYPIEIQAIELITGDGRVVPVRHRWTIQAQETVRLAVGASDANEPPQVVSGHAVRYLLPQFSFRCKNEAIAEDNTIDD